LSPSPLVSLSFLSVNVDFLRVALDGRAGFARRRELVIPHRLLVACDLSSIGKDD
jgi:hypothetical protein